MKNSNSSSQKSDSLFGKENYKWLAISVAVMALGFILMAGGKSSDVNQFKAEDVYSPMRITVAPILILAGLGLGIVAIFKKSKA